MVKEKIIRPASGWLALIVTVGLFFTALFLIISGAIYPPAPPTIVLGVFLIPVAAILTLTSTTFQRAAVRNVAAAHY